MIWIAIILYFAGMAPTWGIVQAGSFMLHGDIINEKWLNSFIIILWPVIGLYMLPTIIKK